MIISPQTVRNIPGSGQCSPNDHPQSGSCVSPGQSHFSTRTNGAQPQPYSSVFVRALLRHLSGPSAAVARPAKRRRTTFGSLGGVCRRQPFAVTCRFEASGVPSAIGRESPRAASGCACLHRHSDGQPGALSYTTSVIAGSRVGLSDQPKDPTPARRGG